MPSKSLRNVARVVPSATARSTAPRRSETRSAWAAPAVHEAPVVIGHPATDSPAHGWIHAVHHGEDGLHASAHLLSAALSEGVREGRYRKVSVSLYGPGCANHPLPDAGAWYLRHVGFLGATPPVVKGLRQAELGEAGEHVHHVTLDFGEENPMPPDDSGNAGATRADLDRRAAELDRRAAELDAADAARAQQAAADFAERIAREGRILPRDQGPIAELLAATPPEAPEGAATVSFAEAEGETPAARAPGAFLRHFLARLPVVVDYGERAPAGDGARATRASITLPAGWQADRDSQALHDRAVQLSERAGISFEAALERIERGG